MPPARGLTQEQVAVTLRQSGRRVTAPRLLVYRLLQESGGHVTAEGILKRALEQGERITLPSVYASLNTLVELELARVAHVRPAGAVTYDARPEPHHHVVCRDCGRIEDVECHAADAPCLDPPAGHDFAIDRAEVTFMGVCASCRATSH